MNASVDKVLITWFKNELRGKVINVNRVSNLMGTSLLKIDTRTKVVTVIEARKLVIRTAPSRAITRKLRSLHLLTFLEEVALTVRMTIAYMINIQENTIELRIAFVIAKGLDRD